MPKRFAFCFLLLVWIASNAFCRETPEHERDLLKVLFDSTRKGLYTNYKNNTTEAQKKLNALFAAVYLAIDGNESQNSMRVVNEKYEILKSFGLSGLPSIAEFITPGGKFHQRYTHRGWDFRYSPLDVAERWDIRKERILLQTIKRVFIFTGYDRSKIEHFGALLYYIHILGDHVENPGTEVREGRIDISGRKDNLDIFSELLIHLPELFKNQRGSPHYERIIKYFRDNKTRHFTEGSAISKEEYDALHKFAQETLDVLFRYIPKLLEEEDFFRLTFPK
jgi:hypothetical protein